MSLFAPLCRSGDGLELGRDDEDLSALLLSAHARLLALRDGAMHPGADVVFQTPAAGAKPSASGELR